MEPKTPEMTTRERLLARVAYDAFRGKTDPGDRLGAEQRRNDFERLTDEERFGWLAAARAGQHCAVNMTFIRLEDGKIFDEAPEAFQGHAQHVPKGWVLCVPISSTVDLNMRRGLVDHFGRVTCITVGSHSEAMGMGVEAFNAQADEKTVQAARNWVAGAKGTVVRARIATTLPGPDNSPFLPEAIELMAKALRERTIPVMQTGTSENIVGHTLIGTERIEHLSTHVALDVDFWITDETAGFACNNSMLCAGVNGKKTRVTKIGGSDSEVVLECELMSVGLVQLENAFPGHSVIRPIGQFV